MDSSRDNGDVTVVISCFDYGRYLAEAVESALGQKGGAPHVIVVDDGSTEPTTLEVLGRLPPEVEVLVRRIAASAQPATQALPASRRRSSSSSTRTTASVQTRWRYCARR